MQLGILFWFYRDPVLCENRLRMLRRKNPGVPIFGLYGGPARDVAFFSRSVGSFIDDLWVFPEDVERDWRWRNGDLMLARWYREHGHELQFDSVFVAQWDLVVATPLSKLLPQMAEKEMLLSGLRPVSEVESWWQWTNGRVRSEYDEFREHLATHYGPVRDPMCCQFIAFVLPRQFLEPYGEIERPELGFLEYKVPMYAQAFGIPLIPDNCLRPWWPEEPATSGVARTEKLMHAWRTPVRLPVMLFERARPGGRRAFHPYHGIYPHDPASLLEMVRHRER